MPLAKSINLLILSCMVDLQLYIFPNQQKFILNGILPSSLQEDNFIFSLNPGPEGESHPKTAFYVQNWFIATSSVAAFLVSVCTIAVITVQCIRYLYPYESSNTVIPTRPLIRWLLRMVVL